MILLLWTGSSKCNNNGITSYCNVVLGVKWIVFVFWEVEFGLFTFFKFYVFLIVWQRWWRRVCRQPGGWTAMFSAKTKSIQWRGAASSKAGMSRTCKSLHHSSFSGSFSKNRRMYIVVSTMTELWESHNTGNYMMILHDYMLGMPEAVISHIWWKEIVKLNIQVKWLRILSHFKCLHKLY